MAQQRKAKEAFGGQVSAFAAARKARAQPTPEEAPEERLAAAIAGVPYHGPPDGDENAIPEDRIQDRASQSKSDLKLSHFDRRNIQQIEQGLEVILKTDQSVTVVGEYDLQVLSGVVSIQGAMLHLTSGVQRVYALTSNALPPILAKKPDTRIRITSVQRGIKLLVQYSPLFRGIGSGDDQSSFTLLRSTADDPLHRTLSTLEVDEDTRKVLSRINARLEAREYAPRILTVGPKSTGKSTLNRLLSNLIITRPGDDKCYYLDLDPGQPEFGAPGQISLVEVVAPLLGPSYTHLASKISTQYRLVRAHTIAAMSFKDDPEHYINCAIDLCRHIPKNVALVVNTCGWVTGLGASVLLDLLPHIHPTDAVTLDSIDSALENGLRSASTAHQIPHRQMKMFPSRTPAELRAMQAMAYFHHSYDLTGSSSWNEESISEMRPWMVSYEAEKPGIAAILSYGQAPHPDFLAEVLEGSLVAIVVPDLINPEAVERTHKEDLPFIIDASSGCSPPLDPSQSRFIGLALVRGIDDVEKRIQLVTPLPETEVVTLLEKQVVLVRGGYDCPEWAYLEDLYLAESRGIEDEDLIDDRPWISKRESHVGVEGAVWRLRHPPMKDAVK